MKTGAASKLMLPEVDDLARQHVLRMLKRCGIVLGALILLIVLLNERQRLIQIVDHPIEKVSVLGSFQHLNVADLKGHVSRYIGSGFLMADLPEVKAYIESLPWVYQAQVSRVWPGEISVVIEEQLPVSYWNNDGLINESGQLFVPENIDMSLAIPSLEFYVDVSEKERLEMFSLLTYMQNELSIYKLDVINLKQNLRGSWEIKLSNGINITLGQIDLGNDGRKFLDDKLERVGRLFLDQTNIPLENIERLDTRYPNGVAVQWKENAQNKQ